MKHDTVGREQCPHCNESLIQKNENRIKIRSGSAIEFTETGAKFSCHWCGEKVAIAGIQLVKKLPRPGFYIENQTT